MEKVHLLAASQDFENKSPPPLNLLSDFHFLQGRSAGVLEKRRVGALSVGALRYVAKKLNP